MSPVAHPAPLALLAPLQGVALASVVGAPRLSAARVAPLQACEVLDEYGQRRSIVIPHERPLTLYVDRHELVTLMTLGAQPELLALGYLLNQGLLARVQDVAAVQVDWDVDAAAITTHHGLPELQAQTTQRIVTTGCGQGTVFGHAQQRVQQLQLPPPDQARISQGGLRRLLDRLRGLDSLHRRAGSVHGCALFAGEAAGGELLCFVEDVGRHNAIDTIAGWMALHGVAGGDKVFYTTGRLTSEMVGKAAQMGVPIVVSRNGVTQRGLQLAQQLGLALFGRAAHRHFLCYSGFDRFDADPLPPGDQPVRVVAGEG